MYLENLSLTYFKNYQECSLNFSENINCILGPNGSGKTNLLDAIYYLSFTKSAFSAVEQQNIHHGQEFYSVRGAFQHSTKKTRVQCSFKSGEKKVVKKDGNPYQKISDHIGRFPVVLISPYDTDILRDGSSIRRKFMDVIISQLDPGYLQNLLKYQRTLLQRNQLLKEFASKQKFDAHLLASYDQPLLILGEKIAHRRQEFVGQFMPLFQDHYRTLCEASESVGIQYKSEALDAEFQRRFLNNYQRDLSLQRTELGVHKDDLICLLGDHLIRKIGSQGQQKSFVVALKLAQFDLIHLEKGFKPILLLDDIFDKLDDHRIGKLIEMVSGNRFGQIFITDARPERTDRILETVEDEIRKIRVEQGHVAEADG